MRSPRPPLGADAVRSEEEGSTVSGATPVSGATVSHEVFAPSGRIRRVSIPVAAEPQAQALSTVTATVKPVEVNGPSSNRIDVVFLGDGYAAADQALFAENVIDNWELLAVREPFSTYRTSFNIWRVDIVSRVSGVSGDPTADVLRDTPLGTTFWCDGLERLLCADVEAAKRYAVRAPDVDQIAVLANSAKYGGAGYTDDELVTVAGNNPLTGEILPHEFGHSIGDLGDEYDYLSFPGDGSTYDGPELEQANLSVHDAREMLALETKWAAWLGTVSPDGGLVGTYEGGFYTQFGVFRPSLNSLMKELLREFNSPSREKMIQSYYSTATPIDSVGPRGAFVRRKATVTLDPLPTATDIRWYVGNKEVRRWRGRLSVRLTGIPASGKKPHNVSVIASDPTSWVIDPTYRQDFLSERRSWRVIR